MIVRAKLLIYSVSDVHCSIVTPNKSIHLEATISREIRRSLETSLTFTWLILSRSCPSFKHAMRYVSLITYKKYCTIMIIKRFLFIFLFIFLSPLVFCEKRSWMILKISGQNLYILLWKFKFLNVLMWRIENLTHLFSFDISLKDV